MLGEYNTANITKPISASVGAFNRMAVGTTQPRANVSRSDLVTSSTGFSQVPALTKSSNCILSFWKTDERLPLKNDKACTSSHKKTKKY